MVRFECSRSQQVSRKEVKPERQMHIGLFFVPMSDSLGKQFRILRRDPSRIRIPRLKVIATGVHHSVETFPVIVSELRVRLIYAQQTN